MSYTITCPICGKRDQGEFAFGNEERGPAPAQKGLTAVDHAEYVHFRRNNPGPQKEWWCHRSGCGVWFTTWRDTLTNREVPDPESAS
ncbi:MAG: sarcosine oxidase subunit delta [Deltaproteobacteria bacterium]|nr:sarcosine oxidase subunit delta [Deltaproteobacteria bacterium]